MGIESSKPPPPPAAQSFGPCEEGDLPVYRFCLTGASGVGKSSFINVFTTGNFIPEHDVTDGTEMYMRRQRLKGPASFPPPRPSELDVIVEIEDTRGCDTADREAVIAPPVMLSYNSSGEIVWTRTEPNGARPRQCFILMFDVTNRVTFEEMSRMLGLLFKRLAVPEGSACPLPVIIAANKVDGGIRAVPVEEVVALAEARGVGMMETSCKLNKGVDQVISRAADLVDIAVASQKMVAGSSISGESAAGGADKAG